MQGGLTVIMGQMQITVLFEVSRGLKHLAEQGILHRDVALRNILLTSNDVVKVTLPEDDKARLLGLKTSHLQGVVVYSTLFKTITMYLSYDHMI